MSRSESMVLISYLVIGIIVFLSVEFLSINIAGFIGSGSNGIGIVVSALSILCAIVVICTMVLVDTIKSNKQ